MHGKVHSSKFERNETKLRAFGGGAKFCPRWLNWQAAFADSARQKWVPNVTKSIIPTYLRILSFIRHQTPNFLVTFGGYLTIGEGEGQRHSFPCFEMPKHEGNNPSDRHQKRRKGQRFSFLSFSIEQTCPNNFHSMGVSFHFRRSWLSSSIWQSSSK